MKSIFRATTAEEASQIASALARMYSADSKAEFLQPDLLYWKLWAPREDYAGPRSFVLERNGEIIAHSGIWPLSIRTDAGTLQGCHLFDWAADARVLGSGVALLRKISEQFDFLCANGGSEMTQKIIPNVGFQKIGMAWFAARPLRPVRLLIHGPMDWRAPARLARDTVRALSRARRASNEWDVREGIGEDEIDAQSRGEVPSPFRSRGFFRYLEQCPGARIRVFRIMRKGRTEGRLALSLLHEQVRVVGVWLSDPSPEARRAAYGLALRVARTMRAAFQIVAAGSTNSSEVAAVSSGLKVLKRTPVFWLSGRTSAPPIRFEFQFADNDSAFMPY